MDFAKLSGFDKNLSYRLTYKLARDIVVVSRQAKNHMVKNEGARADRIHHIDLAYDFNLYGHVDTGRGEEIRRKFKADILLLTVGRMDMHKRSGLSIRLLYGLISKGLDAKLIILGEGELLQTLRNEADLLGVSNKVIMPGYVDNVLSYMSAADFLIHPSISEASSISVKEAGLAQLTPIVCQGIGDFDDIIVNGENGLLVQGDTFVESALEILEGYPEDREKFRQMGKKLKATVLERFDITKTAHYYEEIFHQRA